MRLVVSALIVPLVVGCTTANPAIGVNWRLETLNGLVEPRGKLLIEADGRVSARTACNGYTWNGTMGTNTITFDFREVVSTTALCFGPQDPMEAESAYIGNFHKVSRWRIENDKLYLSDADGNDVMVFHRDDGSTVNPS